jgi:hypothetical protein
MLDSAFAEVDSFDDTKILQLSLLVSPPQPGCLPGMSLPRLSGRPWHNRTDMFVACLLQLARRQVSTAFGYAADLYPLPGLCKDCKQPRPAEAGFIFPQKDFSLCLWIICFLTMRPEQTGYILKFLK